ncbi:Glutamate permease [Anaerococcus octavius]|jgi:sodium/glutamate symporter|uniref:Sodium/glutamate symporter n=1 Tax=Anaerococcus octavius TaxID=54007 RepID=A0A380WRY7_9FIRM|nr:MULTISPECIES: sodium/glutamate symporter [Anaerococcus]MDU4026216.1 sodium/glutamate symporter [Anaerococcus sp.]MDU7411441.1 sodium/glutamate symporter [Anaerococcus sp.]SUU91787.1 Glutamate permease [Anaerococcus octavius]
MEIQLDILQSLGVAIIAYMLGVFIKKKVMFFQKFFIPSPVIGGLIISIINLILKQNGLGFFKFDDIIQDFFMNIFFTCIGLACSFKVLKKSGWLGIKLAIAIILLLPLQNILAVGLAKAMGINPLHGVAMGSTSMTGGIGSAVSFGKIMEGYGATNNTSIGVAAATFGMLIGSLVGGPVAKRLIRVHNLKSTGAQIANIKEKNINQINQKNLMDAIVVIALASFLGTFINKLLAFTNLNFPYYVGCQFGGLITRNIYDLLKKDSHIDNIEVLGNISLNLFLSLALINLNISAMLGLALPMFVIMIAQAIFIAIYTSLVTFNLTSRDYDAAVMVAGHCGVGLGQTPNAIANMEAIIEKEGPADVAMFVLPIVLAIAVNLFNPLVITFFINFLK